jgi:hypothetical protein
MDVNVIRKTLMVDGKTLAKIIDYFMKGEMTKHARVQVQMPNGELHDIQQIKLMENMLVGPYETHRIVLVTEPQKHLMSKVIKSSHIV